MSKTAQIYVLRVWQEARETPNWRASLTNLSNHEKRHFSSPEAFVQFIGELIGSEPHEEKSES